jgi:predicted nucleic acid-binding protein
MKPQSNRTLRVIFDTNIYGFLAQDQTLPELEAKLIHSKTLVVYGCQSIRKELRQKAQKKARITLLELYDHVTKSRMLDETSSTYKLAKEYYSEAKNLKRNLQSWSEFETDFLIIAIASKYNLDVVFSGDDKTMFSNFARNAYQKVNLRNGLRTPSFLSYSLLKETFLN